MERSEPSLAPEWLRSTGSGTGGGSSNHLLASSHSDRSLLYNNRRSSSTNGSTKHDRNPYSRSYSSFSRNHRDREKDKLTGADNWDAEYTEPFSRSMLSGRIEKDTLRRSQSMVSRMPDVVLQRRAPTELRSSFHSNSDNANDGVSASSIATGIQKVTFDRDFPSLGSEDRPVTPELSRVPSPGLSRGVQSLSIGNSALIIGEGWTSALAEVPIGVGSGVGSSPTVQTTAAPSSSGTVNTTAGLNMAEALVQAPLRSQTVPQPLVPTQRIEELAVLQSKRLIPMTPSMPKSLVLNPSDKLKPKTTPRSVEPLVGSKNGSLQLNNQSLRGGNVRADAPKTSHTGKLLFLKPGRENGGPAVASKDVTSPTYVNNRLASVQSIGAPVLGPVPLKNANNQKLFAVERKAHVQSRTDFFNSVRKKSMNSMSTSADSSPVGSSVIVEKSDEEHKDVACDSVSPSAKNDSEVKCNGDGHMTMHSSLHSTDEEEEAAFMRSLGWEPNAGDDEGLTEEEINAFYQEYQKLRPASKLSKGLRSKILTHPEPEAVSEGAASELSPTDSMN
ncbi:hypothetical protein Ancab_036575 [Ancistrocladus abbreviatus]